MSPPVKDDATPGKTRVTDALERYLTSLSAGGSRNTLEWVLQRGEESFRSYLEENGIEHVDEIDTACCRDWGMELRTRTAQDEIAASTAHNYYMYTRAFLSFCVRDRLLETNPAATDAAREFLPEDTGKRDRQFWDEDTREELLSFVHARVDRAYDDDKIDLERAYRDRAFVILLALAGLRGAEAFADPHDDRRNGLTWEDVELDDERGRVTVLGKSRQYERVGLPARAKDALERHRAILEPPSDEWPVFPTGHYPSKRRALEAEYSSDRVETMLEDRSTDEALREFEVPPPSLSKNGARSVMKRLCEEANLEIDGEYLKPHGGRRGLGHELYASGNSELAQSALRHKSIETTHEAYSDIQPEDVAEQIDDVMD
ncbi:tyrosine-type recombinase/integrase [Halostagnicola bangensis]